MSFKKLKARSQKSAGQRGFSLLEVLIATMILGVGLIMVASVFPVGATWSKQTAEDTIATNLAWNAVAIVKAKYGKPTIGGLSPFVQQTPLGDTEIAYYRSGKWEVAGSSLAVGGQRVFGLPAFNHAANATPVQVPIRERTYGFGMGNPYPVNITSVTQNNAWDAQYFWTALIKVPDDNSTTVTLYILVFRRGAREQVFTDAYAQTVLPSANKEIVECRDIGDSNENLKGSPFTPSVYVVQYDKGTLKNNAVTGAWPQMGVLGIGADSGVVFRQQLGGPNFDQAVPSTLLKGQTANTDPPTEPVIVSPPPDNWPDSSLIYIYQTQISF